jgi:hypothetical protein
MSKKDMPIGISLFLVLFLVFEIYYFFVDYLFTGLYPFHGYNLESLGYLPYLIITLFLYCIVIFALYKILQGFYYRDNWARKFTIVFNILASIWPIWAIFIGNRVIENVLFFIIYVFIILFLMSEYVKKYLEESQVFTYGPYTLYTRKVQLLNVDRIIDIYFFSKHEPKSGAPCSMPEGYEVGINTRTKMPYLQKIGKQKPFKYNDYTLYNRKIKLKNVDRLIDIYFFSSHKPKSGKPCVMPEGYEIAINPHTKMPYLKKKVKSGKNIELVEVKKSETEHTQKKPSNVIYVVNKPQPGQVKGDWAVRSHGKIFSHHRTQENAIKQARKIAKQKDSTVMIQGVNGKFREGFKPKK